MKVRDPITKIWKFFVDKCLPFGSSISCALFQRFSDALKHITEYRLRITNRITNYLDDFLFIARTLMFYNYMLRRFLSLCQELQIPVSLEKTEWASEFMIFLGILLNGHDLTLSIPVEKRKLAVEMLTEFVNSKKATVRQLQQLCGYLNFLSRAIVPGRTFTRRMYAKYNAVINVNGAPQDANQYKMKQHYHVRLDREFKVDCKIWLQLLTDEAQHVVNRPMMDIFSVPEDLEDIGFFSDVSASEKDGGFGAILQNQWLQGSWDTQFLIDCKPNIAYLELFAPCAGILTWQN